MGFLDRAIRRGISKGVGDAIGKAVEQAVTPKATEYANKAANQFDKATEATARQTAQTAETAAGLNGAFANLQRSMEGYATEMSKNVKLCPECGQATGSDKNFCPACGAKLPEETVAQGAVCQSCGMQNAVGTRFCAGCGTKLPAAVRQEQESQAKDAEIMRQWTVLLPQYPTWSAGGHDFNIEQYDGYIMFAARLETGFSAQSAVKKYRDALIQSGFRKAGEYPCEEHLYKMVGGICYHCDTEHCFDGDQDCPTLYFNTGEPSGGFNYVKPEPKKPASFMDLFK